MKKMDKLEFAIYTGVGVVAYLICSAFVAKKKLTETVERFV